MFAETLSPLAETREVAAPAGIATLAHVFHRQAVERFEAGATVFWQGDPANQVFEVVEGVLRIAKIMGDGRRVITGFVHPGDLVGISVRDRYLYSAEAVVPVRLRRMPRRRFEEAVERSPELRPELFARLCDEMAAAQEQMVLLARKSAEERVASFLIRLSEREHGRLEAGEVVDLPMNRIDMADYLGLTIETVSRTMTKLSSRRVIANAGRHGIVVLDPERLMALAGDGEPDEAPAGRSRQAVWPQ